MRTPNGALDITATQVYTFTPASTFAGRAAVTTVDRAGNPTTRTFRLHRDAAPPAVWTEVPPRVTTTTVPLAWGARDTGAGVRGYDVALRIDDGPWQPVLTQTQRTAHTFTELPGEVFTFRVTATDNVGNVAVTERKVALVSITKYYYHGGQRVAQRRSTPQGEDVVTFLHPDHLGSTSLATDAAGNVVARRRYYPYGAERWRAGEVPTDFGYTGQRDVVGTGLMYYKARYYYPALGRFVSADTIVPETGNPQALNRYAYVYNNPLNHYDPDGHTPLLVTAVIGAGIGAMVNIGYQTVPILLEGGSIKNAFEQVEWAQVAGAATGGAVMGLTMGAGTALLGTSLGATAISGGVSGIAGGQTGRFTEAAFSEVIEHGHLDRERVCHSAQENGFGDPASIVVDAGTGAVAGVIGHGTNRLLQEVGAIPSPAQGFARESSGVRFDIHGNAYTVSDAIIETSKQQSRIAVLYWEVEKGLAEEFAQVETGNLFDILQPN